MGMPLISSTCPLGVPSWSLPLMQHEDIPTPVDMIAVELEVGRGTMETEGERMLRGVV